MTALKTFAIETLGNGRVSAQLDEALAEIAGFFDEPHLYQRSGGKLRAKVAIDLIFELDCESATPTRRCIATVKLKRPQPLPIDHPIYVRDGCVLAAREPEQAGFFVPMHDTEGGSAK